MPFSTEGLTLDDFLSSDWREAIASAAEPKCDYYQSVFLNKITEAETAGDEKLGNLYSLLGSLTSMRLEPKDEADPLKPLMVTPKARTAAPVDFDSSLDYLIEILPHVDDDELAARVADVIWLRRRDYKIARIAAKSYLDSARLGERKNWRASMDRIERAVTIAAQANQRDLLSQAIQTVQEALGSFTGGEVTYLPLRVMRLLQKRKEGDAVTYSTLSTSFAMAAESRGEWDRARDYWNVTADWFRIARDSEQEKVARIRYAETYVQEAGSLVKSSHNKKYTLASVYLERAFQALRKVGGQKERMTVIHHELLGYQEKSNGEMETYSHRWDATAMIADATEQIKGKTLQEALFALAFICPPPQLENLRQQAEFKQQNEIVELVGTAFHTNARGRTIARQDALEDEEDESEAYIRMHMHDIAKLAHELLVKGLIIPALSQLLQEHQVSEDDLWTVVLNNPFVPKDRAAIYVKGLHAGFREDWLTAAHLLIPQLENSVRYVLEQLGVIASKLDQDGIQDERDLNSTLSLPGFVEPLKKVFGPDLMFDLRGLLVERHGSNLRNDIAHGLLSYNALRSVPAVYFWWITLHILFLPYMGERLAEEIKAEDEGNASSDQSEVSVGGGVSS